MTQGYQCSPQQARLLYLKRAQHALPLQFRFAIELEGRLTPAWLRQALEGLIATHEMFRTSFRIVPGLALPLQVVGEPQLQWSEREDRRPLEELFADGASAIDMLEGPLLLAELLRRDERHHVLLITALSLHFDRITVGSFISDLVASYGQEGAALEYEGPHYIDTSEWVNELLESDEARPGKAFWEEQDFSGLLQLALPLEKRAQVGSYAMGCRPPRVLEGELLVRLQACAATHGTSPAVLCQAALACLVFRLGEQQRFAIGSVFDGRTDGDLAQVRGPLSRALPIVHSLAEEDDFDALITSLSALREAAGEWQECFTWDNLRLPVDEVEFTLGFESAPLFAPTAKHGLVWRLAGDTLTCEPFDVHLLLRHDGDHFEIEFRWDRNAVPVAVVQRLEDMYLTLLDQLTRFPQVRIGGLDLLSSADRSVLVQQGPELALPAVTHVAGLFEDQVAKCSQSAALEYGSHVLSYAELDQRASCLATALAEQGVAAESIVGLFLERSPELVASILALFKLGAAYLPLDPEYPEERLRHMIEDSGCGLILVRESQAGRLPATAARTLSIEVSQSAAPLARRIPVLPEAAAYVIYTSGSTGLPKGTIVSHRELALHALGAASRYELAPGDRMLQFASFNFDASLDQWVAPLLRGATVVLRPAQTWTPPQVEAAVADLRLTVLNFPTAYWHLLANEWADTKVVKLNPQLRLVIVGGEAMLAEHARAWFRGRYADVRLLNAYGPTETTVTATTADIDFETSQEERMPIGQLLPGRRGYVFDAQLRLSDPGLVGYLYLAGIGVARGYLGRPGLTASVFLPDPFASEPGARMYASGDRVRLLSSLLLQYQGRADNQVKIRGYRIELSEVEAAMASHHAVAECVVVPVQRGSSYDLVAWFVPMRNINPDENAIRNYLVRRLPDYMVPAVVMRLPKMPLTPSGKVDRLALPAVELARGPLNEERTETEAALISICEDLLGLQHISKSDNFFSLGGHSLSAMQLVSRLRKTYQFELGLREIFQASDLAQLAAQLDEKRKSGATAVPRVTAVPRDGRIPLSFAQTRLWLLQTADPNATEFHVTATVRISGPLDLAAFERALNGVIARHESLRTRFVLSDNEPVQVITPFRFQRLVLHPLASRYSDPEQAFVEAQRLAEAFARQPFNLSQGPLIRFEIAKLGEGDHLLMSAMHHIISDGWSVGVFTRELVANYHAFIEGREPSLPELPLQYGDFAAWQRQWLAGEAFDKLLAFWRGQLEGAPAVSKLPAARPRPPRPTHAAGRIFFNFPSELSKSIDRIGHGRGTTPFMVLLAALDATIHAFTGERDIVIGSDVANRNRGEMEGVIGFFVNQLVLRTRLDGDPTFADLVARVADTTLNAYAHQDMPFDKLVEALNPRRDPHVAPLFQTVLVLQNTPNAVLALDKLTLSVQPVLSEKTSIDLGFEIWTEPGSGDYAGMMVFNRDLYDNSSAQLVLDSFQRFLELACKDPNHKLSTLVAGLGVSTAQLEEERAQAAQVFWAEQLSACQGAGELIGLGLHRGSELERQSVTLEPRELQKLQLAARRHDLDTMIHSAWALLLYLWSGKDTVMFGTYLSDQTQALPCCLELTPNQTVARLLEQVREHLANLSRHSAGAPDALALSGAGLLDQAAHLAVGLTLLHDPSLLSLAFEHNASPVFHLGIRHRAAGNRLAARLASQFRALLLALTGDAQQPLCQLSAFAEGERQTVLDDWNATAAELPEPLNFDVLFRQQVLRSPHQLALSDFGKRFTYAELDASVEARAAALRALGARPETLIAVFGERSADFLVTLLAIFRSGGAYLPLDPEHPAERLCVVLRSAAPVILVGAPNLHENLERALALLDPATRPTLFDPCGCSDASFTPVPSNTACVSPHQLAYVIYTSGSTGQPKGAMVTQQGMINHLYAKIRDFALVETDRIGQVAPQCFDISIWQFLTALLVGGETHVIEDDCSRDPRQLLQRARGLTMLEVVPSMLSAMLDLSQDRRFELPALRWMMLTGEALPPELCRRWYALNPEVPIANAYGPTECSDDVSHYLIDAAPADHVTAMPLGFPIINTQFFVLNPQGHALAPGIPGELHVAGLGVGRGYWNKPSITAQTFVPNPFCSLPGDRLYRTGDLVRFERTAQAGPRESDPLVFLGRIDFQVKIRGFRIEIGEIEARLLANSLVTACAVIAHRDESGDWHLVAFVVSTREDANALRAWLKSYLPEYMVPSRFVFIDKLPLTANGKLNRKLLVPPKIETERPCEPVTNAERFIHRLWVQLLHIERIGVDDDFFQLGGHSLSGTILLFRLGEATGVKFNLVDLFSAPTVRAMAQRLERALGLDQDDRAALDQAFASLLERRSQVTEQIQAHDHSDLERTYRLSHAQQRLYMAELTAESPSGTFNMPGAVRLRGPLAVDRLATALDLIESRHGTLRTQFLVKAGVPVQRLRPQGARRLERHDLRHLVADDRDRELTRLLQRDAVEPFDLARAYVWRTSLIQLDTDDHVLTMTFHHICADGWSLTLFIEELSEAYAALVNDREPQLAHLGLQYVDYSVWERDHADAGGWERDRLYWTDYLRSFALTPFLRTDRARPATARLDHGHSLDLRLSAELRERLYELATANQATLYQVLLTAYFAALRPFAVRDDLLVGTDVANRNRPETDRLIGFFINQLVMSAYVEGHSSLLGLLHQVRDMAYDAYDHQDLPFDELVKACGGERDPAFAPLFQVKFFFETTGHRVLRLGELALEPLATDPGAARLDLTMGIREDGDSLGGFLNYNTDLFEEATATAILEHFLYIVDRLAAGENPTIEALNTQLQQVSREKASRARDRRRDGLRGRERESTRRVAESAELVQMAPLRPSGLLPLLITPVREGVDLAAWIETNQSQIAELLPRHGALMFRGFAQGEKVEYFERCARGLISRIFTHNGEHRPITENGAVQVPVAYSAEHQLLWHNENTFNHLFPSKILFGCSIPAERGGETPLVDSRLLFEALDPALRERFMRYGVQYMRNYSAELGLTWAKVFGTEDRSEVERICRESHTEFEWREGNRLTTRATRPAAVQHPRTGAWCWTNQSQHWHISCLAEETRASIQALYSDRDYPRQALFGDGSPISDDDMAQILATYRRLEIATPWQQGDLVLVDNLMVAHGRNAYVGPRKLFVSLGDMISYDNLNG